jgi:hypothetical protein
MDAHQLAELIQAHLDGDDLAGLATRTFEDAGVLSGNAGLVIRTTTGAEFQLSIVQSRVAR